MEFVKTFWDGRSWRIVLRSLRRGCAYRLSCSIGTGGGISCLLGLEQPNSLLKCCYLPNKLLNLIALGRGGLGIAYAGDQ
jgi:hypothetical protein